MKFLKNLPGHIYFFVGMLFFVATMLVVFIPIWIISLLPEPACSKALHKAFRIWMGFFMPLVGCPIIRRGKEHFKKGENYVVVINHNSLVDIPVSSPWIPGPNKTLAKAEMAKIPVFGTIYRTGSVLVDRSSEASRTQSFIRMQEALKLGLHLCLYPEGTRNKTKEPLQRFYDGAFRTAIAAQKPIIPGVIFNTGRILPHNKKFWARPLPIYFHFLEPISTEGLTLNDTHILKEKVFDLMKNYYVHNLKSAS
jgi:1-acyl-sn-glycerol-3-phosphate acyltransferase